MQEEQPQAEAAEADLNDEADDLKSDVPVLALIPCL
jgi:hypothetical protein